MRSQYPRGSEWRKWDLHFHTPSSYDYKNKSITNEQIVNHLVDAGIAVVAITDHHLMDCERIRALQELGKVKSLTVLPGIEFCSETRGDEPIHLIGLFAENSDIEYIWGELISKTNLAKQRKEGRSENQLYVSFQDTANLIHDLGGLVSVHAGSKTNTIENVTNSLPVTMAEKTDMAKAVDIYELGKEADQSGYKEKVFPAIGFEIPMVLCSDCHKATEYSVKQNLWIKGNPNFEGLKQIRYEPRQRVRIQAEKPEDKEKYQTISRVRFIQPDGGNNFSNEWISFNQNLNSIIGGKSSGKSLLLYHIAKTIDPARIESINGDNEYFQKLQYSFEENQAFNFEVEWSDGQVSRLKTNEPPVSRPITYIPQLFLNRLAEDRKEDLNELIEVMLGDFSPEHKEFRRNVLERIHEARKEIQSEVQNLFQAKTEYLDLTKELSQLGDKAGIKNAILEINESLARLKAESELSEGEARKYKELTDELSVLEKRSIEINDFAIALEKVDNGLNEIDNQIAKNLQSLFTQIQDTFPNLGGKDIGNLQRAFDILRVELSGTFTSVRSEHFNLGPSMNKELENVSKRIGETVAALNPFKEKIKNQDLFVKLEERKKNEEKKLTDIERKEKEVESAKKKLKVQAVCELYSKILKLYSSIVEKDKEFSSVPGSANLEITSNLEFSQKRFAASFSDKLNQRTSLEKQFDGCFSSSGVFKSDLATIEGNIEHILQDIVEGDVKFKGGHTAEQAASALVDDYFYIDYGLIQDNDNLLKMSPGKKGIILFQLFLHLSKSTDPILIDQPEDNLDNRTVYTELNDFIKEKKIERQIIIVSHNPNLVVSTDSENIIVANQNGQNKSGENNEFQFEFVSGPLECTFDDPKAKGILYQKGIREHVCEILEGGTEAFVKERDVTS